MLKSKIAELRSMIERRLLSAMLACSTSITASLSQSFLHRTCWHYKKKSRPGLACVRPRLVAVSKTKSVELIEEAYKHGQRVFGENYVQELVQKSKYFQEKGVNDIQWHFIGTLQRNKVNNLVGVAQLTVVETVESAKLAAFLNASWLKKTAEHKLSVFVQVNTSGEESKSGCLPSDCVSIVQFIRSTCDALKFAGLMTIGAFDHDYASGPNPDFQCLLRCRDDLCATLSLNASDVELSMGMSGDYEQAIQVGSTNVRIGTTIFGAR